ncbi:MAG TPA: DUF1707 domain-containing protein [Chloroflexota bacterium]|nr:DUF1707 domain-containing protein [Chloroflexota bacterium]
MNMDRMDTKDHLDGLIERDRDRAEGLRASDADRAATADLLRQQYAAGRLDALEFEERVGRCYVAKTVDELRDLVVDLPHGAADQLAPNRVRTGCRPVGRLGMPMGQLRLVVPLVVVLVAVSGLTGAHVVWLVWPLTFFVLRAGLWQAWRGASW